MGKNDNASKKTIQKQKQKVIEEKTFGLKNKNKSKKVQQHINSITKNVLNSGDPKLRKLEEERKAAKAAAKIRKKAEQAEQEALFGEALLAVQKKSTTSTKDGKIEAKGRDAAEDAATNKNKTSAAMKMMYQMDAAEMDTKLKEDPNYVPTIEDDIEMERQKVLNALKAAGKVGTPVTPETFVVWQERKKQKRAEEIKKRVDMELKKKKGGKGLSVLSGRDLYEYKKELFTKMDEDDNIPDTISETESLSVAATAATTVTTASTPAVVEDIAQQLQSDLFLQGHDEDLDDIEDDD